MASLANGYDRVAAEFLAGRGSAASGGIGVRHVRAWARSLPPHAAVLDLGCGSGLPITKVLVDEGLTVYGVDASPTLVAAFRRHLPEVAVARWLHRTSELNGALDFLDAGGNEPHGYGEFMASVDALVIGRHTFDTVLGFGGLGIR